MNGRTVRRDAVEHNRHRSSAARFRVDYSRPRRLDNFFRLKKPDYAIAGYGFFAHFDVIDLHMAWGTFGWKNGDPDKHRFLVRIGAYRKEDLLNGAPSGPLGCTILRDATFWPEERWIPWGESQGWGASIVRGKTEQDSERASALLAAVQDDQARVPGDLEERFRLLQMSQRQMVLRDVATREGQGTFRLRLMRAYDGQCAITGEHTRPVLDAAHIQPYLSPESNHVQNGLLVTKEFHALFDCGYVGITPDYEVRVSEQLRIEWQNGRRYYPYHGARLAHLPADPALRPSPDALAWHFEHVFRRTG